MSDIGETLKQHVIHNRIYDLRRALQGQDINMRIADGNGPFYSVDTTLPLLAVQYNRPQVIKALIEMGCNMDAENGASATALILACWMGRLQLVQMLINAGCDVDHQERKGRTPLLAAAVSCNADIIRAVLVAKGINPDEVNQNAESRAEINSMRFYNYFVLMWAVVNKGCTPEIIRMLVNSGCDPNKVTEDYITSSDITALLMGIDCYRNAQVLQALIDCGAGVHTSYNSGETPLMFACRIRNVDAVMLLLRSGCDVQIKDEFGYTALHHCLTYSANVIIVQMLLSANSNVNSQTNILQTPLMRALLYCTNADIIRLLLSLGADINAVDNNNGTMLIHAMNGRRIDAATVQLLLDAGCGNTINYKTNDDGETALHIAIRRGRFEFVRMLLDVKDIKIDMRKCRQAAAASQINDRDKVKKCLQVVAATVIQRQWRECYWNPKAVVCRKRLMEDREEVEREAKRSRRNDDNYTEYDAEYDAEYDNE